MDIKLKRSVNGKQSFTPNETMELCKKAIWDYIHSNSSMESPMTGTSFHTGVNCEIKTHEETNIDSWWNKQQL